MSIGGTVPSLRGPEMSRKRLPLLVTLTLIGSLMGAFSSLAGPAPVGSNDSINRCYRRIKIMRFRPANIRLIDRR